jgi:subtilisin family serine protease
MKRRAIRVLLVTLVMVLPLCGAAADLGSGTGAHGWRRPAYAPGELLVKYRPAVRTRTAEYFRQRWGVSILHTFAGIGVHHVKLPADMTVEEALDLYRHDTDVEYAEPNYYRHITATPNDTDYQSFLWGMTNTGQTVCPPEGTVCPPYPACVSGTPGASINAPSAWDVETDCTSVTVAIIDTGVDYNHPDLAANIASGGYDFVDNDNAPMDPNGHGTHVAGTIGAVGNNSQGVTGVCWTAQLLPLRAFDASGSGTASDIILAMEYAQNHGAKVINASYGGSQFSQAEYNEISNLNTGEVLLVAAAGNGPTNNDSTPSYPASYNLDNIIAVAATDQNDNLACFSNYGQTSVDVAAPGVNIYSAMPGRQTVFSDNFDGGDISDWTIEPASPPAHPSWGVFSPGYGGTGYSLADSPTGNYANNINISARPTNAIDLSGQTGTVLDFQLKGTILSGDYLYIEDSPDATNWTTRLGLYGSSGNWTEITVDLGNLDGTATAYFRFRLQTNGSGTADGVYIDDVKVTTAQAQDTYQFLDGTSMATPHVTGLAALVWSNAPTLTHLQVKARILNCVDRLASLSRKLVTWGRINAASSLNNVPAPPVGLSARGVSNSQINLTWATTYVGQIGFRIERKQGATDPFTEIANLPTNTSSYSDTGLTKGATYTYRIRAYTSNLSGYSAEVTATASEPSSSGGHGGGGGGGCFIDTALVK